MIKGEHAHLQCTAVGDTPIHIVWKVGGQELPEVGVSDKYTIREQPLLNSVVSELGVADTTRRDTGVFSCLAANAYGKDSMDIQLIVQETPEPPKNIRVTDQQARTIGLNWSQTYTGNSQINHYIVQYKLGSGQLCFKLVTRRSHRYRILHVLQTSGRRSRITWWCLALRPRPRCRTCGRHSSTTSASWRRTGWASARPAS